MLPFFPDFPKRLPNGFPNPFGAPPPFEPQPLITEGADGEQMLAYSVY